MACARQTAGSPGGGRPLLTAVVVAGLGYVGLPLAMRAVAACINWSGDIWALAFAASDAGSDRAEASWECGSVFMRI